MNATNHVFMGTSGWNYKHWKNGVFYDKGLKQSEWLRFYSRHFDTVEINNSFYRLPTTSAFENWREQVPKDFTFAVKASRFLTHIKRLKDPEEPLALFFARANHLRHRLGPVLFQLPPRFKCDLDRLEHFLKALKQHTSRRKLRCAIEFRDPTWLVDPVFNLLSDHRVALCFADWRDMPVIQPITADFVYVRRHSGRAGDSNYSRSELNRDVKLIEQWIHDGFDVYTYFNNDRSGCAIENALYVRNKLEKKSRAA